MGLCKSSLSPSPPPTLPLQVLPSRMLLRIENMLAPLSVFKMELLSVFDMELLPVSKMEPAVKTGSPRYGRIAEPAKPVAAKRTAPPPITPKPFTAKKTGFKDVEISLKGIDLTSRAVTLAGGKRLDQCITITRFPLKQIVFYIVDNGLWPLTRVKY